MTKPQVQKETQVRKGDTVSIEYTGTLSDGEVFDTSKGRDPLQFEVGSGQVIPGFDTAVEGMQLDQEKTFTIPSAEAYGPMRKEMILEIPRNKLPAQPEPKPGMTLALQGPNGERLPAKIVKVEQDIVAIDANHPLAGKDLTFKVKIVGINEVNPNAGAMNSSHSQKGGCCGGGGCGGGSCGSDSMESEGCESGGCSGSCSPEGCEKEDCCKKEGNSKKEGKEKQGSRHGGGCC
ncbi:peptidylprolyl isomerase [Candidatus Woesearchaeota archaeon]|nr:peptidylprolyl isomerase [Candidatus Woesearchaeota archaeon]